MIDEFLNFNHQFDGQKTRFLLLILSGLLLPFFLFSLAKLIISYPSAVEEISKALIILFLLYDLPDLKKYFKFQIIGALIFGAIFALSKNFIYFYASSQIFNLGFFWERFLLIASPHTITALIIFLSLAIGRGAIFFGLPAAIIINFLFTGITSIF